MASTIDFRRLDDGFGVPRNKRKRSVAEEDAAPSAMELDGGDASPSSKRPALPSAEDPSKPAFGRPTYDGVIAGRVSGRKWKQPREQRSSAIRVSHKRTTFEQRAMQKEIKKAYKERMQELKDEIRNNKIEKRKRKEEREKKKQENILRTGTKLQKITNPKTLKKIAKSKQKKLLKVVPDEVFNKNKKAKKLELP
ncbi:rRNA-processing protein CGR1 [Aristolochia californica]|uniref:rRNA-processing protein CGR1 n=1 Tax=Aristolochia californica TaxID=171875 RepID=UPI0035DDAB58